MIHLRENSGCLKITAKRRGDCSCARWYKSYALLTLGPEVEIYLTGQMKEGIVIEASDTIKVINPGGK